MNGVPQIVAAALEATKDMTAEDRDAALAATAAQVMNQMPPRENPRVNKSLDSVHASGPLGRAHCVIHGNSNYQQTGLLQAYAAYSLLQQPPRRVGFASGCQAFGHRELLGVLQPFGLVSPPVLTSAGREAGAAGRLPRQGRLARAGPARASTTDGVVAAPTQEVHDLPVAVAAALQARGVRPGATVAILSANDPVALRVRLRHLAGRRGLVPDQPAQRGGREPRAARPVRLRGADLPGVVRRRWSRRSAATSRSVHTCVCLDGRRARTR